MENRELSRELEEMRSQIAILKSKLDNQKIVTEQQLRSSMKTKMSKIDKTMLRTIIAGCFALVYCSWFFTTRIQLSIAFTVATSALLSACLAITIYKHYSFRRIDLTRGNIVDVTERLTKIKQHYSEWWKIALPILLVWYGWWLYEMFMLYDNSPYMVGLCSGSAVGIIVGLIIGLKINRKIANEANDIINQIRELQQNE